jgi:hypothetical protein
MHWTHGFEPTSLRDMKANDVRTADPIRHGAYLCLRVPADRAPALARSSVPALAERLGLTNEFENEGQDPTNAIAFLRRVQSTATNIADDGLLNADVVVHVASAKSEVVADFCAEALHVLEPLVSVRTLGGVVRPMLYTGNEMFNYSYAHRMLQQRASAAPNAIIVPMSKTADWWKKGWMERHTYFLPRYDDSGRMLNEGHALAAEPGIEVLLRRTYKHESMPAPDGAYDFLNYFECADSALPIFEEVCARLRDVQRNPEWRFVREGPTWYGRRVSSWPGLFATR